MSRDPKPDDFKVIKFINSNVEVNPNNPEETIRPQSFMSLTDGIVLFMELNDTGFPNVAILTGAGIDEDFINGSEIIDRTDEAVRLIYSIYEEIDNLKDLLQTKIHDEKERIYLLCDDPEICQQTKTHCIELFGESFFNQEKDFLVLVPAKKTDKVVSTDITIH